MRWSDGAPFNADDVVFSTQVVLNPANNEVGRDGWNLITKIDEPDKYTVVYHLRHPYASYEPTFFGSAGANPTVLPKHILGNLPNINHAPYNAKPVGIGPFRVVVWRRGEGVDLEPNPYYFRGMPKLKRITYKFIPSRDTLLTSMQTGDVDMWPQAPASFITRLLGISNFRTDVIVTPWYSHLDFNVTRPLVSDVRVREAIRYAIDRRSLVAKVVRGYGIIQESTVSPNVPIAPRPFRSSPTIRPRQTAPGLRRAGALERTAFESRTGSGCPFSSLTTPARRRPTQRSSSSERNSRRSGSRFKRGSTRRRCSLPPSKITASCMAANGT